MVLKCAIIFILARVFGIRLPVSNANFCKTAHEKLQLLKVKDSEQRLIIYVNKEKLSLPTSTSIQPDQGHIRLSAGPPCPNISPKTEHRIGIACFHRDLPLSQIGIKLVID
jgi:hypothetical protein